jgi:HK97 family phage major capsid protein
MSLEDSRVAELKAAQSIIDTAKSEARALTEDERGEVKSRIAKSEGLLQQIKDAAEEGHLRDALGDALRESDDDGNPLPTFKSIGDAYVKSPSYSDAVAALKSGSRFTTAAFDTGIDLKALTAVTPPGVGGRADGASVFKAIARPVVADLLAQSTISGSSLSYLNETAYTNAAAAVAESGVKPASDLTLARVDNVLSKVATLLDVPDEFLQDMDAARGYIDGRLTLFIQLAEEQQVLNGSGTAPNVRGILATSGIQTETGATKADNMDALYRSVTKCRSVALLEPDGLVIHPTDYQNLRLKQDGNQQYYGGGPFTGAYGGSWRRQRSRRVGSAHCHHACDRSGHCCRRRMAGGRDAVPQGRHHDRQHEQRRVEVPEQHHDDPR